jgi:CHAT domain-containing protein
MASDAAASLALMAARRSKGDAELAGLVRERQDLATERQGRDKWLIDTISRPAADTKSLAMHRTRVVAIDTRLAAIDAQLARDFPDYAALASPAPVSVADVQADLRDDEALVLFLDTDDRFRPLPEESFIWVVTKSQVRWLWSELGTSALTRDVAALRCGLDAAAWYGEGTKRCADLLMLPPSQAPKEGDPLPFDTARAHALYMGLLGEVEDLIKGRHLLIVPSGALTQLPFQVLVTKAPTSRDHRAAPWLAREHAVTVLPAVSSLRALRRVGKPSAASRPMIGFGNPLLDGPDARYGELAKLAFDRQRCPETRRQRVANFTGHRGGVSRVETRGGLANVASIKREIPLPETADELCAVAQDVRAEARDVRLGAQATEREIKALSASGELAKYRMVHFATHGALAGQLDGTHEPGLILTPPDTATEEDDGYLSASEIASLKLDADWVILSACNTAAGGATSAEALSGLARAFMYAQARALLVSHWAVYSDATVKLITATVREVARDPKVGRAEALRRSMLALIEKGESHEAHPTYWAPFAVVGEGSSEATPQTTSTRAKANRRTPSSKKATAPDWQAEVWRQ